MQSCSADERSRRLLFQSPLACAPQFPLSQPASHLRPGVEGAHIVSQVQGAADWFGLQHLGIRARDRLPGTDAARAGWSPDTDRRT